MDACVAAMGENNEEHTILTHKRRTTARDVAKSITNRVFNFSMVNLHNY